MDVLIQGAKAGQKQPKRPSIADDTIASISRLKALYLLSEGEIKGLANGAASIELEGTPLVDDSGNPNFEGVEWEIRTGTVDQEHIAGMPSASNEVGINTTLSSDTPYIRKISNTQLSSVNVNISFPLLKQVEDDGDVVGVTVAYAIDVQTDGMGYVTILNTSLKAKTSGRYQKTHNVKLPEAQTSWQIRVRKITADGNNETLFNAMQIDSMGEIIDVKLTYPCSALLYLSFDAKTFNNIPKIAVDTMGAYVQVPTNYDTVTRNSTGIWDGTFKLGYTTNPAWHYYNLVTNDRYGLGKKLQPFMIDKWALEYIARVCDEPVDDGNGGAEPRFTCNLYLQKTEDAYQVLQHIAGIFRGMSFWNGSQIVVDADTARDCEYVITRANVVGGVFVKTGSAASDRHTIAKVAYSNPANNYETDYAMVRNEQAIAQYGINVLDLSAVGCTSEGQAYRMGLAALLAETNRTQTVSFAMGLDGSLPSVASRVDIADMMFTGANTGGRISSVSTNRKVITVDRGNVPVTVGDKLIVNLESGKAQERAITAINGRDITVALAFDAVASENVWAINSDTMPTMPFIVMSVVQNEDGTQYNYTAMQYDPTMYSQIDNGTIIEQRPTLPSNNPYVINAPESVTLTSRHRVEQGINLTTLVITWAQVKDAVAYDVEWRKDDGDWIKLPRTGNISAEVDGIYSGNYLVRVRAVSAFDAISKPTSSILTNIKGKIGLPPAIVGLTATGVLFGMDLKWGFAQGSGDSDYTEIQVGSAPDVNVAPLGQFSYPTNSHTINGLQGNLSQSYRARLVDKLGNKSVWSAWVTGTTDANADKIMDLIQGQIDESSLSEILSTKIADIEINKQEIGQEVLDRIDAITAANDRITDEAAERVEALRLASERTTNLQDFADNLANDVDTVTLAQVQTANGLAVVKERADAFEIENGVQAQRLTYLSSEIGMGYADKTKYANKNRSTVWTFAKTVAHADYTNAQLVTGLSADYQDSSARFTEEINLLATKNEVTATKTSNLSAQMVGGYDGNDLTKLNSGLLFEEAKVRASDVEGLAEQISLLSAGVGEQFDSFEIWHFNKNKEGWTGGLNAAGFLRVQNETITSPAIDDLDGTSYKHVKLRIKKVGNLTWEGLLSYEGGSKTIPEPSFDTDGIAVVSWQMEWTGNITSFSLKLASSAVGESRYSIDWIAVGRPSPGASNAALLRESKVRATETSANASDLVALRSKIEGGNGVPIESSITRKLDTTANLASTTAEDVSTLKSTYEEDMYAYEGTVQTTARTLASATQAEAERLDLLSADVLPKYADETHYVSATKSTQWTYAKTVAADNYAANQRITALKSTFDNSTSELTNELFTLATKDKSIAADISQLYAETDENYGLIQDLDIAISTATTGLAAKVTTISAAAGEAQETADAAAQAATDAAAAAGNKGEVIYGSTEPDVEKRKVQNLWIDTSSGKNTPKRWSGSDWLSVTDKAATDAAVAASAAQGTASNALSQAQAAQQAADASTVKLAEIAADDKLTPTEKKQVKTIWEEIKKTDASIREQAAKYNVSTANYDYVYTALTEYLAPLMGNMGQTNTIVRATFDGRFANLYERRAELYAAITSATEQATSAANSNAATAQQAADAAESKAQKAKEDLSDIYSDGKVTPSEKQQIKSLWLEIKETDVEVRANAAKYSVNLGTYPDAYIALESYVDALLLDMSATTSVSRTTLDSRFEVYYRRRADINRNIVTATKQVAAAAQASADSANNKLLPQNIGTIVEGSGAFATEFGAISGQFVTMQGVIDGQRAAIDVVSAVGNVDKLKNEIAKARLDKDVTNLNAQSTALQNLIDSYSAKIADLLAKRDALAPSDNALRAQYNQQMDELRAARTDAAAQKSVIADQVSQLNAEKAVLDSLKITETNVKAQHTIKIDAGGKIAGFGLVVQKNNFSAFDVRADRFSISAPVGKPNDVNGSSPFMVLTNSQTINGVTVPAGVYARNFYAPRASIDTIQIKDAAIKTLQVGDGAISTLKVAGNAITAAIVNRLAGVVSIGSFYKETTILESTAQTFAGTVTVGFNAERIHTSAGSLATDEILIFNMYRDNILSKSVRIFGSLVNTSGSRGAVDEHGYSVPSLTDFTNVDMNYTYKITATRADFNYSQSELTQQSVKTAGAELRIVNPALQIDIAKR